MSGYGQTQFDIAVIGGGAAGFAAAIAAAGSGFTTVIYAPPSSVPSARTAALLQGSVELLDSLGVWPSLLSDAAPLRAIRIVDAGGRLIRAPEAIFHASEIGLAAFGFNVPNSDLVAALRRHAQSIPDLKVVEASVEEVAPGEGSVAIRAAGESVSARLVIAADGARSQARDAAGIAVTRWQHRQAALVATFAVEHPHGGVSTEFHTGSGPFTLVPLPGERVSLVWVDRPDRAEAAASLDAEQLSRAVEKRAHFIHGVMRLDSAPAVFPLSAAIAERFAGRRTMLVGEAAHLFPPIGAQGLNLGFRDVAALRRVLNRHRADPGEPAALEAYHAARQVDIRTRTLAIEVLNRSLLSGFLPVQAARGLGLSLAASVPILRRALMRQGLGG